VVYKIGPLMSLDLGVSYNMLNLFGKKFEVVDLLNPKRVDSYKALNDDSDPIQFANDEHFIGASRSISSLEIGLTLMFGI
jgi:hypothetical protein